MSNNFGPALNEYLPVLMALVDKKKNLVLPERIKKLCTVLRENGG